MENLRIERRRDSLGVVFDAETGILTMTGSSYPENPVEFFAPLYAWLKTFIATVNRPLIVNITISYLNTSSSKCLLDFLEILDKHYEAGGSVTVNWHYEEGDEDMLETGEELCEDLLLPYQLILLPK
ncbi:hypothetical protein U14_01329 [Candidatus Moduliflexus flocculans]|uniref:SiaC family regulatory phosphoprotein domain-containing protein n=1 Tax=Candidatus Moduliflexus flocculans TaxID=1499966 RepID=A0A0S6VS37_9BACT|nr:hypothetical protein U14_01329 [Candidatus Moduliflexus flocculans]